MITCVLGYGMAPGELSALTAISTTVGTTLCVFAANALNQVTGPPCLVRLTVGCGAHAAHRAHAQWMEVPFDAQMKRTRSRPIVRGQLTPLHAFTFACASATCGGALLALGANPLAAALGLGNVVLYSFVYTPLKRASIINTVSLALVDPYLNPNA